jgi:hypothetical protein
MIYYTQAYTIIMQAARQIRLLGAGFLRRSVGFDTGGLQGKFVVEELTLAQGFLRLSSVLPDNHHSILVEYSSVTAP